MGSPAQESDNFVVQLGAAEGAEEVSLLEPVPPDRQLILSFQQINGHVPVLSLGNQRGLIQKVFTRKKLQDEEKVAKKPQARQVKSFSLLADQTCRSSPIVTIESLSKVSSRCLRRCVTVPASVSSS